MPSILELLGSTIGEYVKEHVINSTGRHSLVLPRVSNSRTTFKMADSALDILADEDGVEVRQAAPNLLEKMFEHKARNGLESHCDFFLHIGGRSSI